VRLRRLSSLAIDVLLPGSPWFSLLGLTLLGGTGGLGAFGVTLSLAGLCVVASAVLIVVQGVLFVLGGRTIGMACAGLVVVRDAAHAPAAAKTVANRNRGALAVDAVVLAMVGAPLTFAYGYDAHEVAAPVACSALMVALFLALEASVVSRTRESIGMRALARRPAPAASTDVRRT
jgi:hypothetical protein